MRSALAALGLGAALLVAGGLFAAESLWVPGLALVALPSASLVWVRLAARRTAIERELSTRRVVEDEPMTVRIAASAGLFPFPGGEIRDPLLPSAAPVAMGRRAVRLRIEASFARRGRRRLPGPSLTVRDPLGLAERTVSPRAAVADEVLVLPRTEPVKRLAGGDPATAGHGRAALSGLAEVELDGLRAYRQGSPASRIHWPSAARAGALLERRLQPDADSRPLVVLDPRAPVDTESLDAAVRAAASLCLALARAGGCAVLLPGDRRAVFVGEELGGWTAVWARLAVVESSALPALGAAAARTGPVFYVAPRPLTRLPRAVGAGAGLRVLVVAGELRGRRPVFEVSGCRGYAVGRSARGAAVA